MAHSKQHISVVHPLCDSFIDDIFDVNVMQFEVSAQLFRDGRLATSRRTSNQHSHWLRAITASQSTA